MKSLSRIVAGVAVAFASATAFASADSYIYWMVDQSNVEFNYAKITIDSGATYLNAYSGATLIGPKVGVAGYTGSTTSGYNTGAIYSGVFDSSNTEMTFLVELYDSSDVRVGYKSLGYESVATAIFGGLNISGAKAAVFSNFRAVPEPTSGMLVLLGLAGLAFRRKKMAS